MKKGLKIIIAIIVIVVIIAGMLIGSYNSLQKQDENVDGKWSQVENQLQRRYDLIPNLVETVKGYASHEAQTFENVVRARTASNSMADLEEVEREYSQAMTQLNIAVEAYPELKANESFQNLMTQLEGTENRIAVARKDYNEAVQSINGKIRTFPTSIIANFSGIEAREYFEVPDEIKENPTVNFN